MNAPHTCAWCGRGFDLGTMRAVLVLPDEDLGKDSRIARFHRHCAGALLAYCADRRERYAALKRVGAGARIENPTAHDHTGGSHDEG